MGITYGQKAEGFTTESAFVKEVESNLKNFVSIQLSMSDLKKAKSMFKKGYTVSDAVSSIIINTKK